MDKKIFNGFDYVAHEAKIIRMRSNRENFIANEKCKDCSMYMTDFAQPSKKRTFVYDNTNVAQKIEGKRFAAGKKYK